jgi:16S rRNA processing protein RimM
LTQTRILLGVVTAAHGIKGEVKVKTFTQSPEGLGAYGPVSTEDGRQIEIAALRPFKSDEVIVRFAGIADRSAAESLKGRSLYVPRAALPATQAGEFYYSDLIGLKAEDPSGNPLGTVRGVHNFGAGDVVEIEFADGTTEFLAFSDANVPAVDIAAGRIVIELPPDAEEGEGEQ